MLDAKPSALKTITEKGVLCLTTKGERGYTIQFNTASQGEENGINGNRV